MASLRTPDPDEHDPKPERILFFHAGPLYIARSGPIHAPHVVHVSDSWAVHGPPRGVERLRVADAIATVLFYHDERTLNRFLDVDRSDSFSYHFRLPLGADMASLIIGRRELDVECGLYTRDASDPTRFTWRAYFAATMIAGPTKPWRLNRWNLTSLICSFEDSAALKGADVDAAQVHFAYTVIAGEYWRLPHRFEAGGRISVMDDETERALAGMPDSRHTANVDVEREEYFLESKSFQRDV